MRKRQSDRVSTLVLGRSSLGAVETALQRMQRVMEMHGWSESKWAEKAELKERSNLNKIIKRMRETGEVSGDMKTFVRLADAAGVSLDWLLLGRGLPVPASLGVIDDGKYPTRPAVLFVGQLLGFPQEVIDFLKAFDAGADDPGADFWLQLLLGKRNEVAARQPSQSGQNP